jgi:hypothetical protein
MGTNGSNVLLRTILAFQLKEIPENLRREGRNSTSISLRHKNNSVASIRERTIPTERPSLVSDVSANFLRIEGAMVSVTNPYGRILGFLDRSRYYCFQVAPRLYSRG